MVALVNVFYLMFAYISLDDDQISVWSTKISLDYYN